MNLVSYSIIFLVILLKGLNWFSPYKSIPGPKTGGTITLIFEKSNFPEKTYKMGGGRSMGVGGEQLLYIDNLKAKPLKRKYTQNDTFSIQPEGEFIILKHRYQAISIFDYLFKKGDTIRFTYLDNKPVATVLNRETHPFEVNYEAKVKSLFFPNENLTPQEKYDHPTTAIDWDKNIKEQIATVQKESKIKIKYYLEKESRLLDSLKANSELPDFVYHYFKEKAARRQLYQDLEEGKITYAQAVDIIKNHKKGPFPELTEGFHYNFLDNVAYIFFISKTKHVKLGETRFVYDYRQAYDTIAQSSLFEGRQRDRLLLNQLQKIVEYFPQKDFQHYFSKFEKDAKDTAMISLIKSSYLLDFDKIRSETKDVHLITFNKKRLTFDELLKTYKGKKVYVDFWASWCAPCRKAMPASRKLRSQNKNVVFLYLSMDQNFEQWKKAAKAERFEYYKHSYLIVNHRTATYLRNLKVQAIPRYLLFDENGKLVHKNAPGPDGKEIVNLLQK